MLYTCGGNGDPVSFIRNFRGRWFIHRHRLPLTGGGSRNTGKGKEDDNTFDCTCAPSHGSFNVFIFKSLFCLRCVVYTRHSAAPASSNNYKQNCVFGLPASSATGKLKFALFSQPNFHGNVLHSRSRWRYKSGNVVPPRWNTASERLIGSPRIP